jgi:hypothetical protein
MKCYTNKPRTIDDLKEYISQETENVLQHVFVGLENFVPFCDNFPYSTWRTAVPGLRNAP